MSNGHSHFNLAKLLILSDKFRQQVLIGLDKFSYPRFIVYLLCLDLCSTSFRVQRLTHFVKVPFWGNTFRFNFLAGEIFQDGCKANQKIEAIN